MWEGRGILILLWYYLSVCLEGLRKNAVTSEKTASYRIYCHVPQFQIKKGQLLTYRPLC